MKKESTNTSKPALQSSAQATDDKTSISTAQDNATLLRRRSLLKGLGAAPLVITLHSGAAMAASSTGSCVGKRGLNPDPCVANTSSDHDSFLRIKVDHEGRDPLEEFDWGESNKKFPGYVMNQTPDRNYCLISVDATGKTKDYNSYDENSVVLASCWMSFT